MILKAAGTFKMNGSSSRVSMFDGEDFAVVRIPFNGKDDAVVQTIPRNPQD